MKLTAAFIICYLSILFSGISSMVMSVYLPVVVNDLLQNESEQTINNAGAYISALFLFGQMFGGLAWGFICDRIGRSRAVMLSTAFYGLFTVVTAFTDSWVLVGVFRFLTGFGVGGVIVTTNILICEIWPEKRRAVALGIVSAAMPVGFIVTGIMNNVLSNWRDAFLTGLIPMAVAVVAAFILSESESWTKNRSSNNNETRAGIFDADYRSNLITGSLIFGTMLIGLWAVFSWTPTWVQSVTADEQQAQQLRGITMMILATAGLVGSMASGFITNALGLRKTLMMCFLMCFVMVFVVFRLNTSITNSTLIQMAILAFFFGISQGVLSVYIPLLFPTVVRASATGFAFNVGRLFTASVVFFIGALVTFLGGYGNAIFIFSFIFLVGLVVTSYSSGKPREFTSNRPTIKFELNATYRC